MDYKLRAKPANTYTVGTSGCDFTTLQAAVDAAVAADASVTIYPGTYDESIRYPSTLPINAFVPGSVIITGTVEAY